METQPAEILADATEQPGSFILHSHEDGINPVYDSASFLC
jgi:hypothetical protein